MSLVIVIMLTVLSCSVKNFVLVQYIYIIIPYYSTDLPVDFVEVMIDSYIGLCLFVYGPPFFITLILLYL